MKNDFLLLVSDYYEVSLFLESRVILEIIFCYLKYCKENNIEPEIDEHIEPSEFAGLNTSIIDHVLYHVDLSHKMEWFFKPLNKSADS